ncbi:MAG TPA: hypothetical protein VLV88_08670 [Terriglobales bacterium]|nr:hypothetical protein [Terriglobales bacterium]
MNSFLLRVVCLLFSLPGFGHCESAFVLQLWDVPKPSAVAAFIPPAPSRHEPSWASNETRF